LNLTAATATAPAVSVVAAIRQAQTVATILVLPVQARPVHRALVAIALDPLAPTMAPLSLARRALALPALRALMAATIPAPPVLALPAHRAPMVAIAPERQDPVLLAPVHPAPAINRVQATVTAAGHQD